MTNELQPPPPVEPTEVEVPPISGILTRRTSGTAPEAIGAAMSGAFQELVEFQTENGLTLQGPPQAIYHRYTPEETEFTVAFPIGAQPDGVQPTRSVRVGPLPSGPAWKIVHRGPYTELARTYEGIAAWLRHEGLWKSDADWAKFSPMWEVYVNDPASTPEEELETAIFVPRP